ncbi:MAG: pyridoxamine 5'-phosphate oxidase family protein [Thermodesulfobacteriota bacterium]|nr:pyridoxamine 5'-phosphate oxidase family protein [Thermodesulfobacteriota bacterium]
MKKFTAFNAEDIKCFEPETKMGLLATINPDGMPHISLITSIQAKDPSHMIWGQFSEGLSKKHVRGNPKTGFLILTMDKKLWRGKAEWTHTETQGQGFEMFNNKPLFRYNAYTGIHTVHYMDLVEHNGRESLPLAGIAGAIAATAMARGSLCAGAEVMGVWTQRMLGRIGNLKFLSFIGDDGFPVIIPALQCMSAGSNRVVFSPLAYKKEFSGLKPGTTVAAFCLTMEMESVQVRGIFTGFRRRRLINMGVIDIDWVYNSMPPLPGQIYPETALNPVTEF